MQVIRPIARGGFGLVEEVQDVDGTRHARKRFDPDPRVAAGPAQREKARKRFVRETRIQAEIDHPNILPITGQELSSAEPTFLMPLATESYRAQVDRDRASGSVTLAPLLDMLAGLEELHRMGYVHRDLKPENVLLVGDRWMLSDFGLALPPSRETTTITSTHDWAGSLAYMPPEQITGFKVTGPAADIFAFGCIIHDLMGTVARVPHARCTVPGALAGVVERCTEFDPANRFPSVAALRNALVAAVASAGEQDSPDTSSLAAMWIAKLTDTPRDMDRDEWIAIVQSVERNEGEADRTAILKAIDVEQLEALRLTDAGLHERLALVVCDWIANGTFLFEYCDVLGARLRHLYEVGDVRLQAEAAMAVLALACSHNRFYVMRLWMRMAGPAASADLADRLSVEMFALDAQALRFMERIEFAISATRQALHSKIRNALEQISKRENEALGLAWLTEESVSQSSDAGHEGAVPA